jgi:hypothetical protein
VSAVTVPVVIQSMLAPLRPLRVRAAFATLRRRLWVFSASSAAVMAMVMGGALVLVLPGVLALLFHALYAPVAVMEEGDVRGTLRRARRLARRSWTTVVVITVLQFALPVLVWIASVNMSVTFELDENLRPREMGYNLSTSGRAVLYQLLNVRRRSPGSDGVLTRRARRRERQRRGPVQARTSRRAGRAEEQPARMRPRSPRATVSTGPPFRAGP